MQHVSGCDSQPFAERPISNGSAWPGVRTTNVESAVGTWPAEAAHLAKWLGLSRPYGDVTALFSNRRVLWTFHPPERGEKLPPVGAGSQSQFELTVQHGGSLWEDSPL